MNGPRAKKLITHRKKNTTTTTTAIVMLVCIGAHSFGEYAHIFQRSFTGLEFLENCEITVELRYTYVIILH